MAYFPNGEAGDVYERKYCERCVHYNDYHCPILLLHLDWNYEQCAETEDGKRKKFILNSFIPTTEDDLFPEQCVMFIEKGDAG